MREIKFRVWDKTLQEMYTDVASLTLGKDILVRKQLPGSKYPLAIHIPYIEAPELMQYSGLKDKNGKEIYEGDITRTHCEELDFIGADGIISTVYFEKGMYQLKEVGYKGTDLLLLSDSCDDLEVIGNIYENPELLEVGQ